MMVEFVPFTKLLSKIVDNRGRTCPTSDTGIPLIATNCVRNDLLYPAFEKVRYVSDETYGNWFRGHPEPGDLIFVCKGTPGRVCVTPDPVSFCIAQDMVAVRANPAKVYPRYLFAVLRSPEVQAEIVNMHVGTLIPHFKKGDFDKLLLPLPDRKVQEGIGDIYFELSAKIELNRRMNATLEAMAQALFKSWFVDFDPVNAKAAGRAPAGMDADTAALFPSEFVESELGLIPKGWAVKPLSESVTLETKSVQPGTTPDQIFAYFSIPAFDERRLPRMELGASIQSNKYLVVRNSVLVSKLNPNTPRIWLPNVATEKVAICSTEFMQFVPFNDSSRSFLYCLMKSEAAQNAVMQTVTGTTGSRQRAQPQQVMKSKFLWADDILIEAYSIVVTPLLEKVVVNLEESEKLSALRDTLLPKLISGQLRIPEAEAMAEAAL